MSAMNNGKTFLLLFLKYLSNFFYAVKLQLDYDNDDGEGPQPLRHVPSHLKVSER